MARKKPNLLWRAMATPREVSDQWQIQTLAWDPVTKKPEWVTVLRGSEDVAEVIANKLSMDRFKLYPLRPGESGFALARAAEEPARTQREDTPRDTPRELDDQPAPVLSGDAFFRGPTHRKPAIREETPRRHGPVGGIKQ